MSNCDLVLERFIPTPVGNTQEHIGCYPASPVHPHARGEHSPFRLYPWSALGSSPRPWGTRTIESPQSCAKRFIPTPVGNTATTPAWDEAPAVHPHARGEHALIIAPKLKTAGSSPRPWGTRALRLCVVRGVRFIPTPVGTTRLPIRRRNAATVHPHARGEHPIKQRVRILLDGSSPRPWGTPS